MSEEQLFQESLDDLRRNAERVGIPPNWECANCGNTVGATFFNKRLLKVCKECFPILVDKLGIIDKVKAYFSLCEEVMKLEGEDVRLRFAISQKSAEAEREGLEILQLFSQELKK